MSAIPKPNFVDMLKKLLVSEYNYTKEDSEKLIKAHSHVVVKGIMTGNLNATAIALQMVEKVKKILTPPKEERKRCCDECEDPWHANQVGPPNQWTCPTCSIRS